MDENFGMHCPRCLYYILGYGMQTLQIKLTRAIVVLPAGLLRISRITGQDTSLWAALAQRAELVAVTVRLRPTGRLPRVHRAEGTLSTGVGVGSWTLGSYRNNQLLKKCKTSISAVRIYTLGFVGPEIHFQMPPNSSGTILQSHVLATFWSATPKIPGIATSMSLP